MIKIGITGAAGYTGGELIRLLLHHPQATIRFVHSKSNAGRPVSDIHEDLTGMTSLTFSADWHEDIDLLFLCLGHGASRKFLSENDFPPHVKIIDLANDFRLTGDARIGNREFIYGLPEWNKDAIQKAQNIANPGCFATAIEIGLLPLAQAQLLEEVHITGITGSTGAGWACTPTSHFSWRDNNIQAYKTLKHQHAAEIQQLLHLLQGSFPTLQENPYALNFVPWRGDFPRGIFTSAVLNCSLSLEAVTGLYKSYYREAAFTIVCDRPVFLKQVVNTNRAVIYLEKAGPKLVVHTAIDNLLKGASGQAMQNMNLMFGLEEQAGLRLKASYF